MVNDQTVVQIFRFGSEILCVDYVYWVAGYGQPDSAGPDVCYFNADQRKIGMILWIIF